MSTDRGEFEAIFSRPPYEFDMARFDESSAWPGNYRDYNVQCTWDGFREARERAIPSAQPAPLDRSDAVNLARNLLEVRDCKGITERGVRVLCDAVMAMDQALTAAQAPTVEEAIALLKIALRDSKGWMQDYSDSIIRDAIDRVATQAQAEPALYISGPYHDGSMSVCELATGRILHKFRLDGPSAPVGDGGQQAGVIEALKREVKHWQEQEAISRRQRREAVEKAAYTLGSLKQLTACKDTESRLHALHEAGHGTDWDQHRRQFARAWEQARATLAKIGARHG